MIIIIVMAVGFGAVAVVVGDGFVVNSTHSRSSRIWRCSVEMLIELSDVGCGTYTYFNWQWWSVVVVVAAAATVDGDIEKNLSHTRTSFMAM